MSKPTFIRKNLKTILLGGILLVSAILAIVFWKQIFTVGELIFHPEAKASVQDKIQSWGISGILLFGFIQFLFVMVTVLPSEPVQVISGLVYGVGRGFLICWASVLLASMLMFVVARHTKKLFGNKKKKEELSERIEKSGKSSFAVVCLMYVLPLFTYGVVAVLAATCTKLKWWQYLIISAAGSAVFIPLTVLVGSLVMRGPWTGIILTLCLLVLVILVMIFKNKLLGLIFRSKKTLDERLNSFVAEKPRKFMYTLFAPIYRRKFVKKNNVQVNYSFDIKNLRPPFLVLSSHPSRRDYVYVIIAMLPHKMNIVMNRWYYHVRLLNPLLPLVGGIPKKLFTADMPAVMNVMRRIKDGGVVSISPEGINTIYGASNPVIPSTAKLVKRLNVPVIGININGAFLTMPKWNYGAKNRGKIELNADILFTPEQTQEKTEQEILDEMNEKLAYNDYKWARENNIVFRAEERTKGLEALLVVCPNCKSQFKTVAADNKIWCTECGNGAFLDASFQLNKIKDDDAFPLDIAEWFKFQESVFAEEVAAEGFELREKCKAETFNKSGFKQVVKYDGELVINKDGVRFIGKDIKTGQAFEIFSPRAGMPMVSMTLNKSIDFYLDDCFYEFVLTDGVKAVKCSMAVNLIYRRYEN